MSDLGSAIARLGNRIHPDAVGDYSEGYADGREWGARVAANRWCATRPEATREEARAFLERLGYDADEILDRLGWPEAPKRTASRCRAPYATAPPPPLLGPGMLGLGRRRSGCPPEPN